MKISPKQIENVLALPGPKRYSHFIKVAADQRTVWGLFSEGWALASDNNGEPAFPVWPAREYAELSAVGLWTGYEPREIDLDTFLESLLPKLRNSNTLLGVFPTPHEKGVTPQLSQVESDLRSELARIE
jgi:hypothetical protein